MTWGCQCELWVRRPHFRILFPSLLRSSCGASTCLPVPHNSFSGCSVDQPPTRLCPHHMHLSTVISALPVLPASLLLFPPPSLVKATTNDFWNRASDMMLGRTKTPGGRNTEFFFFFFLKILLKYGCVQYCVNFY